MSRVQVTLRDIYFAQKTIARIVQRTPLIHSVWLSELTGRSVYLKLESVQQTGSFKIRGATNKLLNLTDKERQRGVVTVSSGNHGRALSYVANQLGIRAVVCVAESVPLVKQEGIRKLGAELKVHGKTYDEAAAHADYLQGKEDLIMVHPFDEPEIIAGQGTIGLELLDHLPQIDTVIVPLSGGGLLGGIALALKSVDGDIQTIGVSMQRGPAMVESLKAGQVVDVVEEPTLADALAGGIGPNHHTFEIIKNYVDETVLVSEDEIARGMAYAFERHHLVIEGGGAVGLAAVLSEKVRHLGQNVVVVLSGSNVDLQLLLKIVQEQSGLR